MLMEMSKQESFQFIFTSSIYKAFIQAHLCVSKCTTMLDDEPVARLLTTCSFICLKIYLPSVFNGDTSSVF